MGARDFAPTAGALAAGRPGIRRWLGLALALLVAACAGGERSCGIRPFAEVPLTIVRNTPLVQASINGQPATLLLDTGAEQVLLTEAAVRRLGLAADLRRPLTVRGAGGTITTFGAAVRGFSLAGLDIPNHTVAVLPYPLPSSVGEPIDGLLGVTVLSAFDIDLDMPARRMTLYGGLVCPDTPIPAWGTPNVGIPAEVSARGRMTLPMLIGTRLTSALLDTGTQTSIVSREAALASGLPAASLDAARPITLRGAGPEPVPARLVRFPEARIGADRFSDVPMIVAERPADAADVILGMDYLGPRRLWLSYARRQVFVAAPPRR